MIITGIGAGKLTSIQLLILFSSLLLAVVFISATGTVYEYESKYNQKIDKILIRNFGIGTVQSAVVLDDSIHHSLKTFSPTNTIFKVQAHDTTVGYYTIRRAKGCKLGGCTLNKDTHGHDGASYEHFDYLTVFSAQGIIQQVRVLNYEPEYGYEICNKRWLNQFVGSNGNGLEYGESIDAISGATTSAFSITVDIGVQSEVIRSAISMGK